MQNNQRWSRGGSKPRPRTQKKSKAKNSPTQDRPSRGQGKECSRRRPRTKDTSASVLQKKKSSEPFFRRSPEKKHFPKNFSGAPQTFNNSKNSAVLEPPIFEDLRLPGQVLDLRGQSQRLQNVSSKPKTSSRTPPMKIMSNNIIIRHYFAFLRYYCNVLQHHYLIYNNRADI